MRSDSSWWYTDRTRSNSLKLESRKFCTNMRKNFLKVRVTEHWQRVVMGSPMETLKTHLDTYQSDLL